MTKEPEYILNILGDLPVIVSHLNNSVGIVKTYIDANSPIITHHNGHHTADRYFYLHERLGSIRQIIESSSNRRYRLSTLIVSKNG
jgi:hypothetical protein